MLRGVGVKRIGIVIFERVEELDVAGPYEVFGWAATMRSDLLAVSLVAETLSPVRCDKAMRILPDFSFEDCPQYDVLFVPGGYGTRLLVTDEKMLAFLKHQAAGSEWIASVCTGLRVLAAAGVVDGKRVTTYHSVIPEMRETGRFAEVLDDVRFIRDGNLVTSAGVSAGIDMALWLIGEIAGDARFARDVQRGIEYFPAPPYTAEV
jgi:transcriptional regulator GlxA family with amidase domain